MPQILATVPVLADFLINNYWTSLGGRHRWDLPLDITTNINDLTPGEGTIAISALHAWQDVANINFNFTTATDANITFSNDGIGIANTDANWTNELMHNATVQISSNWDGGPKTGFYNYFYQTYVHEIGHALGLGHQGPYNVNADYATKALYQNDTWQWSIMSYFDQTNFGGSHAFAVTPMMADIYAVQAVYGANTSTRTGDTVYGFNSNAGSVYDFSQYFQMPAMTLYDAGGFDTLDASGFSVNQQIDLEPGNFSSIGGEVNNIGIYLTTRIETAIGGSGNDIIQGSRTGTHQESLYGRGGDDLLVGYLGSDYLDGGTGADAMHGSFGDDTYVIDNISDTTFENPDEGTDTAFVRNISLALAGTSIERVVLLGAAAINVSGTTAAEYFSGEGNSAANRMSGGSGGDTYVVGAGDTIAELAAGAGIDTVSSTTINVDLASYAFTEHATLLGDLALSAFGNDGDNTLTGNLAANVLDGRGGADLLIGGGGGDTYHLRAGDTIQETVIAGGGLDTVYVYDRNFSLVGTNLERGILRGTTAVFLGGTDNADYLSGEENAAANFLEGVSGDDTYVLGLGDTIGEGATEGSDTLMSSTISIDLQNYPNAENVQLFGTRSLNVFGTAGTNRLEGNGGVNVIDGRGGNDRLFGGGGNDIYHLHQGDTITEALVDGLDTVYVYDFAYSLVGKNVERAILLGANPVSLGGTDAADYLNGETNSAANFLEGVGGNDTYVVGAGDTVGDTLGGGLDWVMSASIDIDLSLYAFVENARAIGTAARTLLGTAGSNTLAGNAAANIINGRAGADTITGGLGKDMLTGGLGGDTFDFNATAESGVTAATRDTITDFRHGLDRIDLKTIDANGAQFGAAAFQLLSAKGAAFTGTAGQLRWQQVDNTGTANDKTIVSGDINGDRIADFQIELTGLKGLTAGDFLL